MSFFRRKLRNALVISQVAIAIVLLIGAGLFFRSLINLLNVNPGFVRQGVVAMQVFLYDHYEKPEKRLSFTREAISQLKNVPGVKAAGVTTSLPFFESSSELVLSDNSRGSTFTCRPGAYSVSYNHNG